MADSCSLKMPDLQALLAEMDALPKAVKTQILKGAVATGASVIRKAAIELAPIFVGEDVMWGGSGDTQEGHPPPGTLKRAIYQTRLVSSCTPTLEVWIVDVHKGARTIMKGSMKGQSTDDRDAYYATWVEYGHYGPTPKGPGPRKVRQATAIAAGTARWIEAKPFMHPAFDQNKQRALQAIGDYINVNLAAATAGLKFIKARS